MGARATVDGNAKLLPGVVNVMEVTVGMLLANANMAQKSKVQLPFGVADDCRCVAFVPCTLYDATPSRLPEMSVLMRRTGQLGEWGRLGFGGGPGHVSTSCLMTSSVCYVVGVVSLVVCACVVCVRTRMCVCVCVCVHACVFAHIVGSISVASMACQHQEV